MDLFFSPMELAEADRKEDRKEESPGVCSPHLSLTLTSSGPNFPFPVKFTWTQHQIFFIPQFD